MKCRKLTLRTEYYIQAGETLHRQSNQKLVRHVDSIVAIRKAQGFSANLDLAYILVVVTWHLLSLLIKPLPHPVKTPGF